MNIYLIGYRCSGKSTVGKLLADRLHRPFIDTDREIVLRTGKSIRQTVEENGWNRFREIERMVMAGIAARSGLVVASGGGVVLDPRNVAAMKASGRLVWLKVSPETVLMRMMSDRASEKDRPGLTDDPPADEIRTTMAIRRPLYQVSGDMTVDTENRRAAAVCEAVFSYLEEKGMLES
jgi:shikimate kinase